MRFRGVIILRGGFGATPIRAAAHFISIFLINAVTLNAQIPPGHAVRPEARTIRQQDDCIIPLLAPLADQASLSADLTFAVRVQSQAATLLWPYDRDRARSIYRRAFQSLACDDSATSKAASGHSPSRLAATAIARQHLRVELLREVAGQDARLAEDLARAFTAPVAGASRGGASRAFNGSPTSSPTQRDVKRCDLLVSVALQIVERDPARAMALAQSSLAFGVSPHFSRLLLSLRAADAERADLLFAYAVGCLERSTDVDLNGLHTLGAFLVSAIDPIAKEPVNRSVVVRFLDCALAQLARLSRMAAGGAGDVSANEGIDAEDEALIYFIGRQRGFEVMQTAIMAINEVLAQREASEPACSIPGVAGEFETDELYGSGFEAAFAALGHADFERAWSLTELFTARDISMLAQLTVCRGGLGRSSYGNERHNELINDRQVVETDGRH